MTRYAVVGVPLCVALGALGVLDNRIFFVVLGACALAGVAAWAYHDPRRLLAFSYFLVLVAATKFRIRDAEEMVSTDVDSQIALELAIYALIALILVMAVASPKFRLPRLGRMERLTVAFIVFAACSTIWSYAPLVTVVRTGQLAILLALVLVTTRISGTAGVLRAIGVSAIVYVLLCSGLALVAPWAHGTKVEASGATRFSWFAMHPISASIYTAIGFSYLACDVLFVPGAWRRRFVGIPTALLLLPLAAIMVAANSRGPLTALLGALGALVVFRYVRPGAAMALVAGCVLILLGAELSGVTFNSLLNRASRSDSPVAQLILRGQTPGEFETLTGRTELWTDLVPLMVERPVSGFGYQASRELLLQIRPWAGHAHNALLQTLIDLGLIGTLLLWIPVCRALFVRPHARAPAASFPAWQSATVFAWMVFSLLNAVGDPGFAGPAGYEVTIVLAAIVVAERLAADPLGDPALGAAAQWGPHSARDARILRTGGGFSVAELS